MRVDGFLLHDAVPWVRLREALSRLTGLPLAEIHALGEVPGVGGLVVEVHAHATGFRTDVTLYGLAEDHQPLAFAAAVAAELRCDVLRAPLEDTPPAVWLRMAPDGRVERVQQRDPDAEDVEVEDPLAR